MTERMKQVLEYLQREGGARTCSEMAYGIGISQGPRRLGSGAAARGGWSGRMSPAQHVIGTTTALYRRGYISLGGRRDGLSGTAYTITKEGQEALQKEGKS